MSGHDENDKKKKKGESHGGGGHSSHGGGHGGGGSHEEHEGAPEWLISFADNVTLMMGFFVIMLAMNMKPAGGEGSGSGAPSAKEPDMIDLALSVREAFNNPVSLNSMNPSDLPLIQRLLERKGATDLNDEGPRGDDQDLQAIRPSDYHQMSGAVPFEDGSAALNAAGKDTLLELAGHVRGLRLIVEVRGHASAAEAFATGDRGMQLSFDRALAAAKVLTEAGLDWKQLRLIASGDNDRMQSLVHDRSGQRRNQRAEVTVTNELMSDTPAAAPPEAGNAPSRESSPPR